ncbi:hypothetical protein [Noviherbaspirillum galbum]|uniref:Uncharacterized protein n=1 Tax=Noviherbaspirillum galbum TaxID=2709383 RepID=A0A6B3SR27_9BURK|nr:hypothetical protein [Noviherbaspirillum galbum]NEX63380.1 hypothetical protein [Noviherbaspirillum galbum]
MSAIRRKILSGSENGVTVDISYDYSAAENFQCAKKIEKNSKLPSHFNRLVYRNKAISVCSIVIGGKRCVCKKTSAFLPGIEISHRICDFSLVLARRQPDFREIF